MKNKIAKMILAAFMVTLLLVVLPSCKKAETDTETPKVCQKCDDAGKTTCECEKKPCCPAGSDKKKECCPAPCDKCVKAGKTTCECPAAKKDCCGTCGGGETKPATGKLVPIIVELPEAVFVGTPDNLSSIPNIEPKKPAGYVRPPLMAPEGTKNVAAGKPVTGTDEDPITGDLDMLTDGDKEATDGSYVEFAPGKQNYTVDLGAKHNIYGVMLWHYHKTGRVYYDIIVQSADDADFIDNVKTLFNNDDDNSSGYGAGKGKNYVEEAKGKLIDAKGVQGRYVRFYSNGNNDSDLNHYIELEVYGTPVK